MTNSRSKTHYQEGSIARGKRAKGPDVWVFRWREVQKDGCRVQRKQVIGNVESYPRKSDAAKKAVENFRAEINARENKVAEWTVEEAWGRFQSEELRDPEVNRSPTTIENYLTLFKAHFIPRWGDTPLKDVEPVEVERWLRSLQTVTPDESTAAKARKQRPLAPSSKAKIKSRMYSLLEHARRHKLCDSDPMDSVRQGSKCLKKPEILTLQEINEKAWEVPDLSVQVLTRGKALDVIELQQIAKLYGKTLNHFLGED